MHGPARIATRLAAPLLVLALLGTHALHARAQDEATGNTPGRYPNASWPSAVR